MDPGGAAASTGLSTPPRSGGERWQVLYGLADEVGDRVWVRSFNLDMHDPLAWIPYFRPAMTLTGRCTVRG